MLCWCIAAQLYLKFPTAEQCNQSAFGELRHRLTQLQTRLEDADPTARATEAYKQAREQCRVIESELGLTQAEAASAPTAPPASAVTPPPGAAEQGGLPWVMATGYINLWKRLHRA